MKHAPHTEPSAAGASRRGSKVLRILSLCFLGISYLALLFAAVRVHPAYHFDYTGLSAAFSARLRLLETFFLPSLAAFFLSAATQLTQHHLSFPAVLLTAAAGFSPICARLFYRITEDPTTASYMASGLLFLTVPAAALAVALSVWKTASVRTGRRLFWLSFALAAPVWLLQLTFACTQPVLGLLPFFYGMPLIAVLIPLAVCAGLRSGILPRVTAGCLLTAAWSFPAAHLAVGFSAEITLTVLSVVCAFTLIAAAASAWLLCRRKTGLRPRESHNRPR